MKIFISLQLVFGLLLLGDCINTNIITRAEQEAPPYAKWGEIAMKKTKEKYPQADIIDYLHIGREKGTEYSIEKFKLWLKKDSKEFGVFIDIKFNNETEKIIDIKYRETTR
ncbi:DUF3889 domain-containing protein [Halobacillus trueperi]|uniref:DUF3889 domain-containing protein n=1 Tax=Halobacillus trueperi TaxID=156205 RepID=A0A3D8VJ12_9BACI|nr:DUF3889 domain-containing protein [Halobacillus trueperi]RDY69121.1 DUF3889 domain-containing protein [Halobacillus trueperi]